MSSVPRSRVGGRDRGTRRSLSSSRLVAILEPSGDASVARLLAFSATAEDDAVETAEEALSPTDP